MKFLRAGVPSVKPIARAPYALAARLAAAVATLTPAGRGKLRTSLHVRRGVTQRFTHWAAEGRDRRRPLLWMHAPSVGEGLQARPVLDTLRTRHPAWQILYTFFSPSAESFARALGVDYTDYLPFDTARDMGALCDALAPSALVFSKLDVWPVLAESAAARGIPLGMISATVSGGLSGLDAEPQTLSRTVLVFPWSEALFLFLVWLGQREWRHRRGRRVHVGATPPPPTLRARFRGAFRQRFVR